MRLCQLVGILDLSRSILYNTCQQPFATAYYPLLSRHIFKRSYATIFFTIMCPTCMSWYEDDGTADAGRATSRPPAWKDCGSSLAMKIFYSWAQFRSADRRYDFIQSPCSLSKHGCLDRKNRFYL